MSGILAQLSARRRNIQPTTKAFKQPYTILILYLTDGTADGRLSNMHFLRGFAHTSAICHCQKNPQISQSHSYVLPDSISCSVTSIIYSLVLLYSV